MSFRVLRSRHGALGIEIDRISGVVRAVSSSRPIDVISWLGREFDHMYCEELSTSVERAATQLLALSSEHGVSPVAREVLTQLQQGKDPIMARKKAEAAAPAEPEVKKTSKKAATPTPVEDTGSPVGRHNRYIGRKIKVLNKTNPCREGSWTCVMLDAILTSKTTDEANEKVAATDFAGKRVDFKWAEDKGFVEIV